MQNYLKPHILFVLSMTALLLCGCVGGALIVDEPPWYSQPSGAHYTSEGRVFYGIGVAGGTSNTTLLRATAVNRARKAMAKVLDGYVEELYLAAGPMPALTVEDGEQLIGSLVRNALKRAVISDHWSDPDLGRYYALCRLDLDTFKMVLESQTAFGPKARAAMWAEAENVHTLIADRPQ